MRFSGYSSHEKLGYNFIRHIGSYQAAMKLLNALQSSLPLADTVNSSPGRQIQIEGSAELRISIEREIGL
jgi:hypothetical protein